VKSFGELLGRAWEEEAACGTRLILVRMYLSIWRASLVDSVNQILIILPGAGKYIGCISL